MDQKQYDELVEIFKDIDSKLVQKFMSYHFNNPKIYDLFSMLAIQMFTNGRARYSAWTIINKMRWDHDISVTGSEFKISNDYIALYARLTIARYPELDGFFEIKQMKRIKKNPKTEGLGVVNLNSIEGLSAGQQV